MANSETIKTTIDVNINTNGNQAITGAVMNSVLKQMIDSTDAQLAELESKNDTKLSDLAKEIETELLGVDAKTNSNYSEIVKLGAKLSVFRGGAMYIYSEKTEDGLYKVGEISHMYYNDKLYHLPTAIGEKLEIDNMPFSLVIERVENPYVKITGFGLNNLKIKPIYFGNPLTIPTELMPTDSELNEESDKLLPNSVITKEINAVQSEIETMQTEMESQSELIEDLYNTKIDKEADDYYPQLSVGVADNLAGHEDATPSEIGFRRSGGGAILDGNARIEAIKGNSVVWNQLINETYLGASDATITKTDTGYTIVPAGATPGLRTSVPNGSIMPIVGHKYAIITEKTGGTRNIYLNWGGFNTGLTSPIFTATDATKTQLIIHSYNETETFTITTPLLIDLTQMFGAGNEPTTIDEFNARKPLGIDEYAYNEGEVIHNATDKIESVGVNQWDEEWELGSISLNGVESDSTTQIRSKTFTKILSGHSYNILSPKNAGLIILYDKDKNCVDWLTLMDRVLEVPSNVSFFKLTFIPAYGTTYKGDICINLSDPSINGKYFPYVKREQSLDIIGKYFPQGMKSAGTAHDEIRYNKTTQKWEKVEATGIRAYQEGDTDNASYLTDGKVTCYPLAEPIVTEIEETINLDYPVWNVGTEKAIANVPSTPLKADIIYGFNAYGVIKELLARVASLEAANASLASQLASLASQLASVTSHNEGV